MATTENKESKKNLKLLFKEHYEIDFARPLPELNVNNSLAYHVTDVSNKKKPVYALVANNDTPPRVSALQQLSTVEHQNILKLLDYGVAEYLPKKTQNMVLIYKRPQFPNILDIAQETRDLLIKDKEKLGNVILSLISAIETFYGYNIPHRAIRAENIYFKDENFDSILLGDCAGCFPGLAQPAMTETIEATAADDIAKGQGTEKNDFYSLGVCILSLLIGDDYSSVMSDEEIIKSKLSEGSYAFLTKGIDVPKWITPLIKGLLDDNEETRWKYMQAYSFIKDKEYIPKRHSITRLTKPLLINNKKYFNPKEVVYAMGTNPKEAIEIIKSGKLADWIKLGLEDITLLEEYNKILSQSLKPEVLLAKVCITLCPYLPIFFKGLSFFPQGVPKAIYAALRASDNQKVSIYKEAIVADLLNFWYFKQSFVRSPANIAELGKYIDNKEYGYGVERIIYDFDNDLPCNSRLLDGSFVNSTGSLLRVLDKNIGPQDVVFDNSIVAYLRCKLGKKAEQFLTDLNSGKYEERPLAVLKLYVALQNKYGPKKLLNLSQAMLNFCSSLTQRYSNAATQEDVEARLVIAADTGVLQKIYNVLEDKSLLEKDKSKHNKAVTKVVMLSSEKNSILSQQADEEAAFKQIGVKFCIVLSLFTALTSLILSLLKQVF